MNKKWLTGSMLALAAGIWGYVGLQFFSGQGETQEISLPADIEGKTTPDLKIAQQETLLLSYPDPFLREQLRPLTALPPPKKQMHAVASKKEEKTAAPVYKWPDIVYRGLIRNKTRPDRPVGVIVIDGQERIVREGENINGLNIAGIAANRVEITHEKEKKVFVK